MGSVFPGVPPLLARAIRETFAVRTFVETGTFRGDTARWATGVFDEVFSVEASTAIYLQTKL